MQRKSRAPDFGSVATKGGIMALNNKENGENVKCIQCKGCIQCTDESCIYNSRGNSDN